MIASENHFDVAIIGGGPAGSTVGTLLRKYNPELRVVILEKEKFPREHVGESQLPPIGAILDEMGCWDKVERAEFPIKIGVTYRWGSSKELWDFDFLPVDSFVDRPRPSPYEGQRVRTALQVDRARYDKILLDHAESQGCQVRQQTLVKQIDRNGSVIKQLTLGDGSSLTADWYVDCSGNVGVLRRALDIAVDYPSNLKNIAVWDYWENAKWADEIGVGGTRVQVLSQKHGWMWFIPLGPTRTSIGLIMPVEFYKSSEHSAEEIYTQTIANDPRIAELTSGATRRGELETISDWSYLSKQTCGDNWFLAGESAGFADPILAAGMTLAQGSARECAYSILELIRGRHDPDWIKSSFDTNQRSRIRQHIRFADFWYASNGQFSDLQDHCQQIAKEAGMELSSQEAWQWISQGGFTSNVPGQAVVAGFLNLASAKRCVEMFTDGEIPWCCDQNNVFHLNLDGATQEAMPIYHAGEIQIKQSLVRDGLRLPLTGLNEQVVAAIRHSPYIDEMIKFYMLRVTAQVSDPAARKNHLVYFLEALEELVSRGWITGSLDKTRARLQIGNASNSQHIKIRAEK